jgi:ERCC4-type nuclease
LKGGDEMTLICDTRQQYGKHKNIEAYCKRMGIEMVRRKLDVGDYMIENGFPISVDTKQDL